MAVVGQLNKAAISFPVEPRGAYSARMGIPSTNSIGATIAFSARLLRLALLPNTVRHLPPRSPEGQRRVVWDYWAYDFTLAQSPITYEPK